MCKTTDAIERSPQAQRQLVEIVFTCKQLVEFWHLLYPRKPDGTQARA
jgi:hypothetical protein